MSNIIHGRDLIVKMNGVAVAACKSCSISITGDLIEVASPLSAQYKEFIQGRISWAITTSQLVTDGILLSAASLINQKVEVKFSFDNEINPDDSIVMSGTAIINQIKIDATVGNLAQGSFSFQGSGTLKYS